MSSTNATRDGRLAALRTRTQRVRTPVNAPIMLGPPRAVSQQRPQLAERGTPPAESMDASRRLLTLEEAGRILRVGRTTVWEMVNAGELAAVRIRGKLLIPCEEPERYLADLIEDARAAAKARQSLRRNRRRRA